MYNLGEDKVNKPLESSFLLFVKLKLSSKGCCDRLSKLRNICKVLRFISSDNFIQEVSSNAGYINASSFSQS